MANKKEEDLEELRYQVALHLGFDRVERQPGNQFEKVWVREFVEGPTTPAPHYTTEIKDAWVLVERMKDKSIFNMGYVYGNWEVSVEMRDETIYEDAPSAPVAICNAFLRFAERQERDESSAL